MKYCFSIHVLNEIGEIFYHCSKWYSVLDDCYYRMLRYINGKMFIKAIGRNIYASGKDILKIHILCDVKREGELNEMYEGYYKRIRSFKKEGLDIGSGIYYFKLPDNKIPLYTVNL